jgi:hypothetical protein
MINPNLSLLDFGPPLLRASDVTAFGAGTVRVVTLRKGFQLFKLTKGLAPAHPQYGVTPWWSPVRPYAEDYEGALGRYQQAQLNGIDMSAMVRYMSAVCIDWNDLDNYLQVELLDDCKAFWGTFAPQKKFSKAPETPEEIMLARIKDGQVNREAVLPPDLGVLEAWQFYVPGLQDAHLRRSGPISAHDMTALAMHFGVH